jgi:hypothetical protein
VPALELGCGSPVGGLIEGGSVAWAVSVGAGVAVGGNVGANVGAIVGATVGALVGCCDAGCGVVTPSEGSTDAPVVGAGVVVGPTDTQPATRKSAQIETDSDFFK